MTKGVFRKVLICGIIILFIGTSSSPSTETSTKKSHMNSREESKAMLDFTAPQTRECTSLLKEVKTQQTLQRDISYFYAYEFYGPLDGFLRMGI